MSRLRILVIDDEAPIRDLIEDVLTLEKFEVAQAVDGINALNSLKKSRFDLIILDINMPKLDGLALLEKIRSEGNQTPVLMLSARNDKQDINQGLRIGADDYVTKPFGIEELVLRVRAILRRTTTDSTISHFQCGPISLKLDQHEVTFEGERVDLSPTEFSLLLHLMENKNRVVSKEALLSSVWDYNFENNSTVVETYISYLRRNCIVIWQMVLLTVALKQCAVLDSRWLISIHEIARSLDGIDISHSDYLDRNYWLICN